MNKEGLGQFREALCEAMRFIDVQADVPGDTGLEKMLEGINELCDLALKGLETTPPEVVQQGSWPADDLRRAFVAGARWWEYASDSATMWPADVRRAEEEAEKRYTPSPLAPSTQEKP